MMNCCRSQILVFNSAYLYVITDCLTFSSYHVSLMIVAPDCPLRESYDFKLFILVYQEYFSSKQHLIDNHVCIQLLALVLKLLFEFLVHWTLASFGYFKIFVVRL